MVLEILRKIGLSDGEIKVYNALLDLGASSVNNIHEKVGIERRNVYDILNKLIERGLVTYITENKRRLFQISHPHKMVEYIEEKKHDLDKTKDEIEKEIPYFVSRYNLKRSDVNAEVFRGIEGIKAVWEDMLNYKAIYWIGSGRYIPKGYPQWFANWNKKRIRLKIKMFNLVRNELRKEIKQLKYENIKFLPEEFSGNPTVIGVHGAKVVNFLLGKNLFAFVIENKELAENYKRYHKYLWDNVATK